MLGRTAEYLKDNMILRMWIDMIGERLYHRRRQSHGPIY